MTPVYRPPNTNVCVCVRARAYVYLFIYFAYWSARTSGHFHSRALVTERADENKARAYYAYLIVEECCTLLRHEIYCVLNVTAPIVTSPRPRLFKNTTMTGWPIHLTVVYQGALCIQIHDLKFLD